MVLLKKVTDMLADLGLELVHLDATIIAQRPKLAPYHDAMVDSLASVMGCSPDKLNLKATTTEKLGIPGREEGIAAEAICTLSKRFNNPSKGECNT